MHDRSSLEVERVLVILRVYAMMQVYAQSTVEVSSSFYAKVPWLFNFVSKKITRKKKNTSSTFLLTFLKKISILCSIYLMNISERGNVYFKLSNFKKFQENILRLPNLFFSPRY